MRKGFCSLCIFLWMGSFLHCLDTDEIGQWINNKRTEEGLTSLVLEKSLFLSAVSYASELSERGILSHRDGEDRGPLERYKAMGGTALAAGEILGTCSSDAPGADLLEAWWKSESHRHQIMKESWTCFGLALVERDGVLIAVVEFSSSLITDYSFTTDGEDVLFAFAPVPGMEELLFYEPLQRKSRVRGEGDEREWSYKTSDFPLLLEIRNLPEEPDGARGNRILLMEPPGPEN